MLLLIFTSITVIEASKLDIVPYPKLAETHSGAVSLDEKNFEMTISECYFDCDVLERAIVRYEDIIFKKLGSSGIVYRLSIFEDRINATLPSGPTDELSRLTLRVRTKVRTTPLSYMLESNFYILKKGIY
jgi:hypothetical protein